LTDTRASPGTLPPHPRLPSVRRDPRGVLGLTADALAAINRALWPIVVSVDLLLYIVLVSRLPRYHLDLWLDEHHVMH
jgi:hypothetical protein